MLLRRSLSHLAQSLTLDIHQGYQSGCIGRISELHASFYSAHAGFGSYFEAKVARELSDFVERLDAARDGLWLARVDGRIEGSIAIDGIDAANKGAHLRWFIVSDALRGSGAGHQLINAALAFSRAKEYPRVYLWTFAGLHAARHLYEKRGFRLAEEATGEQWGTRVTEQRFEWPG